MEDQAFNLIDDPSITINLNGNKLKFTEKGKWELEVSDLDLVTLEIESLVSDKEKLAIALQNTLNQVDLLNKEIQESNKMKTLAMEMVRRFVFLSSCLQITWHFFVVNARTATKNCIRKSDRWIQRRVTE